MKTASHVIPPADDALAAYLTANILDRKARASTSDCDSSCTYRLRLSRIAQRLDYLARPTLLMVYGHVAGRHIAQFLCKRLHPIEWNTYL